MLKRAGALAVERPHQPGNDDLPEDDGIRPDFNLAPEVTALGIDPRGFWHVALAQEQVNI